MVRHCIYAVDKNPLAVDLCKVALWIECHTAGLPLGFLDHHVKCGDSLVGVMDLDVLNEGIPDDAYKAVTGDDKKAAAWYRKRNKRERTTGQRSLVLESSSMDTAVLAGDYETFGEMEESTADEVKTLEELYGDMRGRDTSWWQLKTACDLWTYAFFAPLQTAGPGEPDLVPTTDTVRRVLNSDSLGTQLEEDALQASRSHPYFHWPLEFPDVFKNGGFDVILGNPPWDQVQLDPREFFTTTAPDVANQPNMAARNRAIVGLAQSNPDLYYEYQHAVKTMKSLQKFIHSSGRYPKTSFGRLNYAPLFAEHSRNLQHPTGRAGVIVPTGIATDSFTQHFFADIVDKRSLVSLFDFENKGPVFPGVHRSYKFCLLTLSGFERPCANAEFAFFLHSTEHLQESVRRFGLSAEDFSLFNPNTRTCPIFRTRRDMEIARKMYHHAGVFWRESQDDQPESNPWGVKFQLMFMMNTDSYLFRNHQQLTAEGYQLEGNVFIRDEEHYLPLYEAKLFHQYDHRFATFAEATSEALERGNARNMTSEEKADPHAITIPRYWVNEREVITRLSNQSEPVILPQSDNPTIRQSDNPTIRQSDNPTIETGEGYSTCSTNSHTVGSQRHHQCNKRANGNRNNDSSLCDGVTGKEYLGWLIAFRDITRSTDGRTAIVALSWGTAMSHHVPIVHIHPGRWLQVLRDTTHATNERTVIADSSPMVGLGHTAPLLEYTEARAIASSLVLANMNSLPLDWTARLSVGGTHLSFFIIRQLPILPPESYLEEVSLGHTYVELVVPRVLELTYTAHDMEPFARDLGYEGEPFIWDDRRRHQLKSELDAIYAHMYKLEREELEWILDAKPPSASFPTLKRNECKEFKEYRTKRYVLTAYDQMARGELPDLSDSE